LEDGGALCLRVEAEDRRKKIEYRIQETVGKERWRMEERFARGWRQKKE
jgi:hypothetical protein